MYHCEVLFTESCNVPRPLVFQGGSFCNIIIMSRGKKRRKGDRARKKKQRGEDGRVEEEERGGAMGT